MDTRLNVHDIDDGYNDVRGRMREWKGEMNSKRQRHTSTKESRRENRKVWEIEIERESKREREEWVKECAEMILRFSYSSREERMSGMIFKRALLGLVY